MEKKEYEIVDSVEKLEAALKRVRAAQKTFATYTQEQVDAIFTAAATAANQARIPLAKMAVEETGMGVVEDKVIKNHYASEYIYNAYRDVKTCGVLEEDKAFGIKKIADSPAASKLLIINLNIIFLYVLKSLMLYLINNSYIKYITQNMQSIYAI